MKKFLKGAVICALILMTTLFSGCLDLFFDLDSGGTGGGSGGGTSTNIEKLDGYKICYKNENYKLDDTIEQYSNLILTELYSNFAIPNTSEHKSIAELNISDDISNYDRIRAQLSATTIISSPWIWTLPTALSKANLIEEGNLSNYASYYSTSQLQSAYYETFIDSYSKPMQIVVMQIILGKEAYTFDISPSPSYNISYNGNSIDSVYTNVKTEFCQNARYVGFTENNILSFKDYILNSVIGHSITQTFNSIKTSSGTITYSEALDKILSLSPSGLTKSFLNPFPADNIMDIKNSAYYYNQNTHSVDHIPSMEYHSYILMPNSDMEFVSIGMYYQCDFDIKINVKLNHILKTGEVQTCGSASIDIKGGAFDEKHQTSFISGDAEFVTAHAFDNTSLSANIGTAITNQNGLSKFYTYSDTRTGLDSTIYGDDFFEVNFEIERTDSTPPYCPFKFAISSFFGGF